MNCVHIISNVICIFNAILSHYFATLKESKAQPPSAFTYVIIMRAYSEFHPARDWAPLWTALATKAKKASQRSPASDEQATTLCYQIE